MPVLGWGTSVTAVKRGARPCAGWVEPALISCPCGLGASLAGRRALESRSVPLLLPHLLGKAEHQPPSSGRMEGRGRDAGAEVLTLCSSCFASWWEAPCSNAGQGEV